MAGRVQSDEPRKKRDHLVPQKVHAGERYDAQDMRDDNRLRKFRHPGAHCQQAQGRWVEHDEYALQRVDHHQEGIAERVLLQAGPSLARKQRYGVERDEGSEEDSDDDRKAQHQLAGLIHHIPKPLYEGFDRLDVQS